jgi:hypothetical protein
MRTFAGLGTAHGSCVGQTSDGGFIVAGTTTSNIPRDTSNGAYLVKTDSQGNLEWQRILGGFGALSVQQTADGGYVMAGEGKLVPSLPSGACLVKTDGQGNIEWQSVVSDTLRADGYSVAQTEDGGYAIAAVCPLRDTGLLLIKTDSLGERQWVRLYPADYGYAMMYNIVQVRQTTDRGYIVATKTLLKVDSLGNQQWLRTYAGVTGDYSGAYSVVQTADGGYAATGRADDPRDEHKIQIFLLKTDAQGNQQWMRKYAESKFSRGYCVEQTTDGGYVIAGATYEAGYVLRTDATGTEIWSDALHGMDEPSPRSVCQTSDNGFVVAGSCFDVSRDGDVLSLMKLAPEH